jgi:hypothetical protein
MPSLEQTAPGWDRAEDSRTLERNYRIQACVFKKEL